MHRSAVLGLVLWLAASAVSAAEPVAYALDAERSRVGFEVDFGPDLIKGRVPVRSARVILDFENTANSVIDVTLDTRRAQANFPFATHALRGPQILDAKQFPTISFRSHHVEAEGSRARVSGDITIRGRTRPVVFDAEIFRQRGQPAGDLSRLSVLMTGQLPRDAFGATGWSSFVGNDVTISILVRVTRSG